MQTRKKFTNIIKTICNLSILYLYFEKDIYNIHSTNTRRAKLNMHLEKHTGYGIKTFHQIPVSLTRKMNIFITSCLHRIPSIPLSHLP